MAPRTIQATMVYALLELGQLKRELLRAARTGKLHRLPVEQITIKPRHLNAPTPAPPVKPQNNQDEDRGQGYP